MEKESKKKILVISGSFLPDIKPRAFRTTELVKEFSRQGHKVVLYIPKNPNVHKQFEKEYKVEIKDLGARLPGINCQKGSYFLRIVKRAIGRILLMTLDYPSILFMFQTKSILSKIPKGKFDLLITVAVPHPIHWGAGWSWRIKHKVATTWVADCGDPFVGLVYGRFKHLFYFKYFENLFLDQADFISVPFSAMKKYFNQRFISKCTIIPQGFNFDSINIEFKPSKTIVPTFIFAGQVLPGLRDPFELIEFLIYSKREFRFILYTRQMWLFDSYSKYLNKSIILRDYIPREELLKELSKVDFVVNVNIENCSESDTVATPSKLIDYSIVKRPILSYTQGNLNKDVVLEFLEGDYRKEYVVKNIQEYEIQNVVKKFINLCNK